MTYSIRKLALATTTADDSMLVAAAALAEPLTISADEFKREFAASPAIVLLSTELDWYRTVVILFLSL
jgi:hypothetical protein